MANRMRHWQRVRQGSSEETKWRQTMWKWKMYTPEYTDIHLETWHRHNYVSMLGLSLLLLLFVTDGTAPIYPAQSAFDYSLNPPSIAWHTDAYTWPNWVNERFLFFEFDSNFCGWRQCATSHSRSGPLHFERNFHAARYNNVQITTKIVTEITKRRKHTNARSVFAWNKLDGEVFAFMFSCRFATLGLDRVDEVIEAGIAYDVRGTRLSMARRGCDRNQS